MSNRDTELALGSTPGEEPSPAPAPRANATSRRPRSGWPLTQPRAAAEPGRPAAMPGLAPAAASARAARFQGGTSRRDAGAHRSRLLTACTAVVVLIDPNCALGFWSFQAQNARRRRRATPASTKRR